MVVTKFHPHGAIIRAFGYVIEIDEAKTATIFHEDHRQNSKEWVAFIEDKDIMELVANAFNAIEDEINKRSDRDTRSSSPRRKRAMPPLHLVL